MSNEDLISYYVSLALDAIDEGRTVDLTDICKDHPHLIADVEEILGLNSSLDGECPADPLLNAILNNRYALDERIGAGAMGAVYAARDRSLEREVAVKVLQAGFLSSTRRRERFVREAKILAALDHPNVVSIFDHGLTEHGLHFLVMERLRGATAATILDTLDRTTNSLPTSNGFQERYGIEPHASDYIPLVAGWGAQLAAALAEAHQAGVLHRDLKPSNLFINSDGEAVLLDFGIATLEGDEDLTLGGTTLGSPWYMAPEQSIDPDRIDQRVDIYGLCATLYHLLTMQPPYEGEYANVLVMLRFEEPAPPNAVRPQLPRDICAILEKGMERNPDMRYQTAGELEADLRAFIAHMPVAARQLTRVGRFARRVRRRPWAALTVLALVLTAFGAAFSNSVIEAHARADASELSDASASLPAMLTFERYPADWPVAQMKEQNDALPLLDRILALDPADHPARLRRAAIRLDRSDFEGCMADLTECFGANPTPYLTAVLDRFRRADQSQRGTRSVSLQDLPEAADGFDSYVAGFLWMRRPPRNLKPAIACLERAGNYAPARSLQLLARMLLHGFGTADLEVRDIKLREVIADCKSLELELGRTTAVTQYVIGMAYAKRKLYYAARPALEAALADRPRHHTTLQNLGYVYRRIGLTDRARSLVEESHTLRPWSWRCLVELAQIYCVAGEYEQALKWVGNLEQHEVCRRLTWLSPNLAGFISLHRSASHRIANRLDEAKASAARAEHYYRLSQERGLKTRKVAQCIQLAAAYQHPGSTDEELIGYLRAFETDAMDPTTVNAVLTAIPDTGLSESATQELKNWLRRLRQELSTGRDFITEEESFISEAEAIRSSSDLTTPK